MTQDQIQAIIAEQHGDLFMPELGILPPSVTVGEGFVAYTSPVDVNGNRLGDGGKLVVLVACEFDPIATDKTGKPDPETGIGTGKNWKGGSIGNVSIPYNRKARKSDGTVQSDLVTMLATVNVYRKGQHTVG